MLLNMPNILSLFRIISAPFLLLTGWFNMPTLFFILFGLMLLSDALDGIIARMLDQTTELGARLDSYGDILTYLSTPLAVWCDYCLYTTCFFCSAKVWKACQLSYMDH